MEIERVAVVGAGIMGRGIAEVVAGAGYQVSLVDVSAEALDDAMQRIGRSVARRVSAGALTDVAAKELQGRIEVSTDLAAVARRADHAIETVTEQLDVKRAIFEVLDRECREEVVLCTNTSQFSITSIASATRRPDRVIGTHWFNPPPVMRLIEIVRGEHTSDAAVGVAIAQAERYGKQTIVCQKDTQGFVTSRLIMLFILEAARIYEEGIASAEDIDTACRLAFNHAMGPLDTADLSGLDTLLHGALAMTEHYGERFRPPETLRRLVDAGKLGKKSNAGFRAAGV